MMELMKLYPIPGFDDYDISEDGRVYSHKVNGSRNERMAFSKCHKPVEAITSDGQVLSEFVGVKEASRITGISHSQINKCCRGEISQTHGIRWRYKNDRY